MKPCSDPAILGPPGLRTSIPYPGRILGCPGSHLTPMTEHCKFICRRPVLSPVLAIPFRTWSQVCGRMRERNWSFFTVSFSTVSRIKYSYFIVRSLRISQPLCMERVGAILSFHTGDIKACGEGPDSHCHTTPNLPAWKPFLLYTNLCQCGQACGLMVAHGEEV